MLLIFILLLWPERARKAVMYLFDICTDSFGWLYLTACIISFAFLIWLSLGRFGSVKLGGKDEKPQYSDISWIAMLFTAGVGTSIVILGFLEPIYYVSSPPFQIVPFSETAYEYAHMYGQFHWGFSAWAFYNPAIVAVAYMMYVKKKSSIRLSSACGILLNKHTDGWLGYCIDILVVFGVVDSISTSLGIGTPVLADVIRKVFGIPKDYELIVKMVVLTVWILIFGTSVYLGLDKGIQRLSNINIGMAFLFMLVVLLAGPTVDILKMEVNSAGL